MTQPDGYLNYDPFAGLYDRTRAIPPRIVDSVVDLCGKAANMKRDGFFLDAGVGTGRFGAALGRAYPGRVVGVDVSSEMLIRARQKSSDLRLARGDLLRLPFRRAVFRGALIVHILHLVERWQDLLDEVRRVVVPGGVLLLGAEQGGRSILVDFYLQQARARGLHVDSIGAPGLAQPLAYLKVPISRGVLPRVELLSSTKLSWRKQASAAQTLALLDERPYSQMRAIPNDAHDELMTMTRNYAVDKLGAIDSVEELVTRFVLYSIRS